MTPTMPRGVEGSSPVRRGVSEMNDTEGGRAMRAANCAAYKSIVGGIPITTEPAR